MKKKQVDKLIKELYLADHSNWFGFGEIYIDAIGKWLRKKLLPSKSRGKKIKKT
jgi:hypothetical protein